MAYFEMYYVLIVLISIQESMVRQYQQSQVSSDTPAEARAKPRFSAGPRPAPARLDRRRS
jgi:hypothetical protein